MKACGLMTYVAEGQKLTGSNRLDGLSYQDSIHNNVIARSKVCRGELMLRWDIGLQNVLSARPFDTFGSFQVRQRNQDIVTGIELHYTGSHG